jgi:DNA-binding CsgD family transcriptional regulator
VRSAVYRAASPQERRSVHRALAEATDPAADPDGRAWHRAQAAPGPDEGVAEELERSAGRARARGGLAAAAAFLELAAKLTGEPTRRAQRALAAAQALHRSGAPDAALRLLATAEAGPLDELQCARADLLRGQIAFAVSPGGDAPPLLLKAARRLEPLDAGLSRETYLEALHAAMFGGRMTRGGAVLEEARAARAAPPAPQPPRAADLLLDSLAVLATEGYAAGTPMLKRALSCFRDQDISPEDEIRWLGLACSAAIIVWDEEAWHLLCARHVQLARDAGALMVLPLALNMLSGVHLSAGELAAAAALIDEAAAATEAAGSHIAPYGAMAFAAWQGHEAEASELIETSMKNVGARGAGVGQTVMQWANAVLHNGLGQYEQALAATQQTYEQDTTWGLVERIEAAARCGEAALGADALLLLSQTTSAAGSDWALGTEARSRALLSEGEAAESLYREAIDRLGRTRARVDLGRAHLVYGEWLRRERRRLDAREQLRTAVEMLAAMGVDAFAERATRELRATGETARKRTTQTFGQLTAQEAQISRLARDGLSNPEIAARLFISPRTVEYHLHKVFAKLDITSRNQLAGVLSSDPRPA